MEHSIDIEKYVKGGEFGEPKLSEKEIKKHEIDEGLSEIERSLVLLK